MLGKSSVLAGVSIVAIDVAGCQSALSSRKESWSCHSSCAYTQRTHNYKFIRIQPKITPFVVVLVWSSSVCVFRTLCVWCVCVCVCVCACVCSWACWQIMFLFLCFFLLSFDKFVLILLLLNIIITMSSVRSF